MYEPWCIRMYSCEVEGCCGELRIFAKEEDALEEFRWECL